MEWEDDHNIYTSESKTIRIFRLVIRLRIRSVFGLKMAINKWIKGVLVRMKTMRVTMLLKDLTSEAAVMVSFRRVPSMRGVGADDFFFFCL